MTYTAKCSAQVICEATDKTSTQILKLDTVTQTLDHVALYALDFGVRQEVSVSHDQLSHVSFIIIKGSQPFDVSLIGTSSNPVYTGIKSTFYMRVFPNPSRIDHIRIKGGDIAGRFDLMIGVTVPT